MDEDLLALADLLLGMTILALAVPLARLLPLPPVGGVSLPPVLRLCGAASLLAGGLLLAGLVEPATAARRIGLTLLATFLLGSAGRASGGTGHR